MIVAIFVEILVLVLLLRYTLKQKTGEPFSKKTIRRFMIYGLLTGVILVVLMLITPVEPHFFFGKMNPVAVGFVTALLLAAIPEEIIKYVMFRLAIRKNGEIKVVHDVIIVSVIIAFGFSALEDIEYTLVDGGGAIIRALIPTHLLFQMIMGYYYGRARAENKSLFHILSLAVPIIVHTIFDMFIISLMACIDGINISELSESDITSLPYYNLFIPLLICTISVAVISVIGMIIAFVKIKSKRNSSLMQASLN